MDQLQRIGRASRDYYSQIEPADLTEEDFSLWIDSLDEPMKTGFSNRGLNECRGVLNFLRFILELNDYGMDEYMRNELTEEDYQYWRDQGK